jgi:hypothetical protein
MLHTRNLRFNIHFSVIFKTRPNVHYFSGSTYIRRLFINKSRLNPMKLPKNAAKGILLLFSLVIAQISEASEPVDSLELEEIVVTGNSASRRISKIQIGAESLELGKLSQTPSMFGEGDIIKSISLLPGIRSEGEGAGGFEVRGGTAAQNLILADGMTLYNPAHVMGIFSTFNEDALAAATLYKGPIPARYGNAGASVLDVALAPGDMERYHAGGTIGILAAKLKAEGPVVKEKASFAVAARRSYVDMFLKMVPEYRDIVMNFYDVSAKLSSILSDRDRLDICFFTGRDNMAIDIMGMHWGNIAGSVVWRTSAGDRWSFASTAAATSYSSEMDMNIMASSQAIDEYIHSFNFNEHIRFSLSDKHELSAGLRSEVLKIKSAEWTVNGVNEKETRGGWRNSIWLAYTGDINGHIGIDGGIRLTTFSVLNGSGFSSFFSRSDDYPDFSSKTYVNAEPRVSLRYSLNRNHSLKAGFGITSQDTHALRSGTTSFPSDRYALSSKNIKPEKCVQYSAGYSGMIHDGEWEWSAEAYYKDMHNVYDYKDGLSMFSSINLESLILGGKGRSYGLELMLRKNSGRLNGWISYTLSKTQTRIHGINDGLWYDASNDRRHNASVVAIFRLTDRWNISATWSFSSGQALTVPDVKYELDGATCYYYSSRNSYRTPPPHHLDLSATYIHTGKKMAYEWAFGIYNLYNRYNPYIIYFVDDDTKPSGTAAMQRSLYGIVPSVSYTLKF